MESACSTLLFKHAWFGQCIAWICCGSLMCAHDSELWYVAATSCLRKGANDNTQQSDRSNTNSAHQKAERQFEDVL
jgi:hypothetical protein